MTVWRAVVVIALALTGPVVVAGAAGADCLQVNAVVYLHRGPVTDPIGVDRCVVPTTWGTGFHVTHTVTVPEFLPPETPASVGLSVQFDMWVPSPIVQP